MDPLEIVDFGLYKVLPAIEKVLHFGCGISWFYRKVI